MTAHEHAHDDVAVPALMELRDRRRRRRMGEWNVIDALYRAYLAAIGGTLAITFLSGMVGDRRLAGHELSDLRSMGPAAVGLVGALALAAGLRSGARGGPVALEAAEVRHVLLAPVDRDVAMRRPALRQLRFAAFAGLVTGAVVGLLAYRRLPGQPLVWVMADAVIGMAFALAACAVAMVASGRRTGRWVTSLAGLLLLAWSALDVAAGQTTSPLSIAGRAALWPLVAAPALGLVVALVIAAAAVLAGVACLGGLSLEAAERRGRLVSHLRFAATFQDLRTVMLLRRQLSAEVPRPRPWVRLRPAHRGPVAWRRDWRGILRWPATRVARLTALGIVAGLAMAGAWAGTTPLVVVAGAALFVAALDATEGLAQEIDHPDRRDSLPVPSGALHLRHLAAPTVVLSGVALVAVAAAAMAAGGSSSLALQIGLPLVVPTSALAAGAAAVSGLMGPPDPGRLSADSTGFALIFRQALPPLLATAGPAAVLLARSAVESKSAVEPLAAALDATGLVVFLAVLVLGWVRHREGIKTFFSGQGLSQVGR